MSKDKVQSSIMFLLYICRRLESLSLIGKLNGWCISNKEVNAFTLLGKIYIKYLFKNDDWRDKREN